LEKRLIEGSVSTHYIPVYWNDLYKKYLGVNVPDDKRGCLQDIHWCHGSFGYFPTYSLGSLYAAQLLSTAKNQIPELTSKIELGDSSCLLDWLRDNIYPWGRLFTSEELCRKVTGEGLNTRFFLDYLLDKYGNIYDL
jgi:carboxypeptidase Taq